MQGLRVQDLGEQGLLQRLQRFCPPEVVGDDGAIVTLSPGKSLVVTTDALVDGVHFSDRTTSAADAGWRAAAANLSDLAAMGADPLGITVALGLPGGVQVAWVEQLYQGMTECLQPYATPIVGGDVCRSPILTVTITAFGQVNPQQVIRRSTAQPGDAIVVTGVHGSSKAGLELLLHPELGQGLMESDRATLIQSHQRPVPRLDVLPLLPGRKEEQSPFRLAGMDSSDGLADAVMQICRASGVGARVERNQVPIAPALTHLSPEHALNWALYGGEDFELVLCLPVDAAQTLVNQLAAGAAIVGTMTAVSDVLLVDSSKKHPEKRLSLDQGFQHF